MRDYIPVRHSKIGLKSITGGSSGFLTPKAFVILLYNTDSIFTQFITDGISQKIGNGKIKSQTLLNDAITTQTNIMDESSKRKTCAARASDFLDVERRVHTLRNK